MGDMNGRRPDPLGGDVQEFDVDVFEVFRLC